MGFRGPRVPECGGEQCGDAAGPAEGPDPQISPHGPGQPGGAAHSRRALQPARPQPGRPSAERGGQTVVLLTLPLKCISSVASIEKKKFLSVKI